MGLAANGAGYVDSKASINLILSAKSLRSLKLGSGFATSCDGCGAWGSF